MIDVSHLSYQLKKCYRISRNFKICSYITLASCKKLVIMSVFRELILTLKNLLLV